MTVLKVVGGVLLGLVVLVLLYAAGYYGGIIGNRVQAHYNKAVIDSKVTQQVFNPNNKIQSQGYFEALHADFNGFLVKIRIQKAAAKASGSAYDAANLVGIEQECVDAAQQYNAAALSLGQAPFRSVDLPFQLDPARCA